MVAINGNEVERECPMCGSAWRMELDDDELRCYEEYLEGWGFIQELLPDLNRCEREFLKSGYCAECQKMLFGNGDTERIY